MTSKEDAQFCLKRLQNEIGLGAKIIGYIEDPGSEEWGDDYGFGLLIKTKENEEVRLWISADPEGNAPGFIHMEDHHA